MAGEMGDHDQRLGLDDQGGDLDRAEHAAGDLHVALLVSPDPVGHEGRHAGFTDAEAVGRSQFQMFDGIAPLAGVKGGCFGQEGVGFPLFHQAGHHPEMERPNVPLRPFLAEMRLEGDHVPGFDKRKKIPGDERWFKLPRNRIIGFLVGDPNEKNVFLHPVCSHDPDGQPL